MQMKKRVLSVLLALCLAGSLASTAWAAGDQATPETAEADTSAVVLNEEEEQQDETTASQEETSGEESTAAPAEDPVAQVTETEADDGSVEYTAALETGGQTMNVVVTAPEGAFAENVQPELSVTMLTAEDELNAVADKLDTAEVQYDGFAALDITFTDKATGEEIEPVQQVSVRIELPKAIVDSGIDLNTLAVQHLEEDADGNVQNVTEVATLDNGITLSEEAAAAVNEAAGVAPMSDLPAEEATAGDATETPAAVAEFDVDGFSSFVITWQADWHSDGTIRVTYWNTEEDGSELTVPNQYVFDIGELNDGDTITLQNDKLIVKGKEYEIPQQVTVGNDTYKYIGAKCNYDNKWQDFTTIQLKIPDYYIGWDYKVDGNGSDSRPDIRLQYEKVSTDPGTGGDQGGTGTTSATITAGKSAVKIDGTNNYTLNLSVSGDRGSQTQKQAVDVLFIIDRSASMEKSLGGWQTKIGAVKSAVSTLVNSINDPQDSIEVRYGAIRFSNANGTRTVGNGWYSENNASNFISQINAINTNEGTNWEAGIHKAIETLDGSDRPNATKIVVFLSDGVPTYSGGFDGESQHGNGSDHASSDRGQSEETISEFADDAAKEIEKLDCDYFFAIGIGSDFNLGNRGRTYMTRLTDHVQTGIPTRVLSANNETDLESAFNMIEEATRFFAANNVVMVDPMSEYADLVPVSGGSNNGQYEFTLALEKKASDEGDYLPVQGAFQTVYVTANSTQGTTVTLQDGAEQVPITVFVDKDDSTGKETIRVVFGQTSDGKSYELAQNYRYTVSTVITPSQKAITEGKDEYNGEGEANTGTHAGADGFWSNDNDNALVNYNAITTDENGNITDSTPGTPVYFPKPVIQVPEKTTVDLTLEKTFVGLTDAEVNYLIFRDDGFGWDINYCQPDLREGTEKKDGEEITYATYMADEDAVKGITLPDGIAVTGGGDFRITAKQFLETGDNALTQIAGITDPASGYTNNSTGASLKKVDGNWVYSVTLQVPKAEGGYFYTVFEQHGEVPGYAKLDDSNVVYTVTGIEGLTGGTGKFIDSEDSDKNVYVDMDTEVSSVKVTVNGKEYTIDGEEAAINQGVLQRLDITDDTTIAFKNHYTGDLKVSKTVSGISEEDLTSEELADKTFTITLQPSENIVNLELLDGRTISYTIAHTGGTTTLGSAVMDKDESCAIQVDLKYGDTITFQEIPAIQYTVTENAPAADGGYDIGSYTWIEAEYSETSENFGDRQKDEDHWNHNGLSEPDRRYYTTIGTDNAGDHILSVDSKIGDSRPVQTLQITNEYVEYKSLTIEKDITGTLAIPTDRFTFTITGATGITAEDITKSDDDITVTVADGTITANLGKGDSITINKLTDTHKLTISEASGDYTPIIDLTGVDGYVKGNPDENTESQHSGFTVSGNQVTVTVGSVTDDVGNGTSLGTVKYNNQKNVTPPTGLESNHTTPYTLMVTAAGIAGLALIGGIVVRRRRRRME